MKRAITAAALLTAVCLLAACGPDMGWKKKGVHSSTPQIDQENCIWEVTHPKNSDGTYDVRELEDEELEIEIRRCMKAKGYEWGEVDD